MIDVIFDVWMYWGLAVAQLTFARYMVFTRKPGEAREVERTLDPVELAYLGGGLARAVEATIVAVHRRDLVEVHDGRMHFQDSVDVPPDSSQTAQEVFVHRLMPALATPRTRDELIEIARPLEAELSERLQNRDLLVRGYAVLGWIVGASATAWIVVGEALLSIALLREVGWLVLIIPGATALPVIAWYLSPTRLTTLGKRVLREAEWRTYSDELIAKTDPMRLDGPALARVYALFGASTLTAPALAPFVGARFGATRMGWLQLARDIWKPTPEHVPLSIRRR
jgi:uncharacterized protein (TIGR04222 family)